MASDLISRKALIEDVKKHFDAMYGDDGKLLYSDHIFNGEDVEDLIDFVKRQPTVDRWIPCSERLPEEYKGVLVDTGGIYEIAWRNGETWHHKGGWFNDSKVVAWMPLPEPYKAGDIDG